VYFSHFLSPKFPVSRFQNPPLTFLGIALDSIAAIAIDAPQTISIQHSDDWGDPKDF
jgi:hypothetical protein